MAHLMLQHQLPDTLHDHSDFIDMIKIPGGTFRMGSDKHYPEEAPHFASSWMVSGWTAIP